MANIKLLQYPGNAGRPMCTGAGAAASEPAAVGNGHRFIDTRAAGRSLPGHDTPAREARIVVFMQVSVVLS